MIILSSPAKTQDFDTKWKSVLQTEPEFLDDASKIVQKIRTLTKSQLASLLQVSPALADKNYKRFKEWSVVAHTTYGKPAILAYNGDILKQMLPATYSSEQQHYAQHSVRFLTGLYGMLRPYDLMLPYRLEMKAKIAVGDAKDIVHFWNHILTTALIRDVSEENDPLLVDASSAEYSRPLDFTQIKHPWVRVEFREQEGSRLRNVGLFSKKARGMLLEYCIRNEVQTLDKLKQFSVGGYHFFSENKHQVVFVRKQS